MIYKGVGGLGLSDRHKDKTEFYVFWNKNVFVITKMHCCQSCILSVTILKQKCTLYLTQKLSDNKDNISFRKMFSVVIR